MIEQKRNPGKEMKIRKKKNQMENLELKRMISKMKIKVHCIGLIDFREQNKNNNEFENRAKGSIRFEKQKKN